TSDFEQYVITGGLQRLCAGFSLQARTGNKIFRSAGIGDELGKDDALAEPVKHTGCGERSRANSCQSIAPAAREVRGESWEIRRPCCRDFFVAVRRLVLRGEHQRMVVESRSLGFIEGEPDWGLREGFDRGKTNQQKNISYRHLNSDGVWHCRRGPRS